MKPGGGRAKGHAWERSVAAMMRQLWPHARRGVDQCQNGGVLPDVTGTPFWVECKIGRRTNIKAAVEQACEERERVGSDLTPVIVTKDDHEEPLATMRLDDWWELVEEWQSLKGQAAHVAAAGDELANRLFALDGKGPP